MLQKILVLGVFSLCFLNVSSLALDKLDSQEKSEGNHTKDNVLESIKEFVRVVEKYNLNVSIIGSSKKYGSGGWVKESASLTLQMPLNDDFVKEATLDDAKQAKYLEKIERFVNKEHVGAKTRVIKIKDGEDQLADEKSVNPQYLINSPNYETLTNYHNGVAGFTIPENETCEILYNYIIKNPSSNGVKNLQVITVNVVMNETAVSKDFPPDVLTEIKQVLPKLWMSIGDQTLLARLLGDHLDKKFNGNFQVLTGVDKFALGGKSFVNLEVGNTNVVVFNLA